MKEWTVWKKDRKKCDRVGICVIASDVQNAIDEAIRTGDIALNEILAIELSLDMNKEPI